MPATVLKGTLFFLLLFFFSKPLSSYAQTTTSLPGGLPIPSLEDERKTYRAWGWTWTPDEEPDYQTDPTYTVSGIDMHSDTESDDLWAYTMMYRRTGQGGYKRRMEQWARYYRDDYTQCIPSGTSNYCYDRDTWLGDHTYGWGLVAYYEFTGDSSYLAAAERIAADVETRAASVTPGSTRMAYYCARKWARLLHIAVRVAEANPIPRWITLRNKLIDAWVQSPDWDSARGMYFCSDFTTDAVVGPGSYAAGTRIHSAFQIGVLAEALYQAYRTTGRTDVKERLVAMANFVDQYGLDPTYQYTASWFGIKDGNIWHSYSSSGTATFWDTNYTTSLVNTLVLGYKLTGNRHFYDRAKYVFNRGTKGVYGSPTQRSSPDNVVDHFVDSTFDSASGSFYLAFNKGELQYTYLLFENGGLPSTDTTPPARPKNLTVK